MSDALLIVTYGIGSLVAFVVMSRTAPLDDGEDFVAAIGAGLIWPVLVVGGLLWGLFRLARYGVR